MLRIVILEVLVVEITENTGIPEALLVQPVSQFTSKPDGDGYAFNVPSLGAS